MLGSTFPLLPAVFDHCQSAMIASSYLIPLNAASRNMAGVTLAGIAIGIGLNCAGCICCGCIMLDMRPSIWPMSVEPVLGLDPGITSVPASNPAVDGTPSDAVAPAGTDPTGAEAVMPPPGKPPDIGKAGVPSNFPIHPSVKCLLVTSSTPPGNIVLLKLGLILALSGMLFQTASLATLSDG